jgi:hypothetical protein
MIADMSDIWGEADEMQTSATMSRPGTPGIMTPIDLPGHSARGTLRDDGPQVPISVPNGGVRARYPRAPVPGENIEMTSAPVNRRGQF